MSISNKTAEKFTRCIFPLASEQLPWQPIAIATKSKGNKPNPITYTKIVVLKQIYYSLETSDVSFEPSKMPNLIARKASILRKEVLIL